LNKLGQPRTIKLSDHHMCVFVCPKNNIAAFLSGYYRLFLVTECAKIYIGRTNLWVNKIIIFVQGDTGTNTWTVIKSKNNQEQRTQTSVCWCHALQHNQGKSTYNSRNLLRNLRSTKPRSRDSKFKSSSNDSHGPLSANSYG